MRQATKKGRGLILFAVMMGAIAHSHATQAQSGRDACAAYAKSAVEEELQNRAQKCGFQGPRWSTEVDEHLAWCQVFPQFAVREQQERVKLLQRCADLPRDAARRAFCDHYAAIADAQAASNAKSRCEFSGPRWLAGREVHFEWCMTQRSGVLDMESVARESDLALCFAQINDFADYDSDCDGFARRAVQQNTINNTRRCGLQGREWIGDYQVLKRYCEESPPAERLEILRNHQRQLQWCSQN